MEKFAIGVLVGGLLGAVVVANNQKMRMLVKKAQEESQAKLNAFMDEKISDLESGVKKASETVQDKSEELAENVKEKFSKKAKKNA